MTSKFPGSSRRKEALTFCSAFRVPRSGFGWSLLTSAATTLVLALATPLRAEPLVTAFDRFHAGQPTAEGGRLLFNELGCANCHGGESALPARRGPALTEVTWRVQSTWLQTYLVDPAAARPGTTMPHVLPADDSQAAEAVVHYLASLRSKTAPKAKTLRHVNTERGKDLFHTTGCVACHAPGTDYLPSEGMPAPGDFTHRTVAFPQLGEKYVLSTLADYLRDPLKENPAGRMPRIAMEEQDTVDIAGYLLGHEGSDGTIAPKIKPPATEAKLVERGRALVTTARCAACHDLPKEVAAKTVPLSRLTGGCLDVTTKPGVPRYDLSASQQAALKLFLAQQVQAEDPGQLAKLTLEALNCAACHDRDGLGGPEAARRAYFHGDHNLGDTGRYPPPLTGIGRKLQPDWLAKVLTGEARVRPYLKVQMPIYGAATATLPTLLAKADARAEKTLPEGDVEAGRKLLGVLGGNSCITCHGWGERASLGIQGQNLSQLAQRIQPGWLHEYLINPAGYRAGTLMPSFWPEGKAANTEILGGDTTKQIAAIYAFARSGKGLPEGFPDTASREFELLPDSRPIVQRTFMQGVGTHAILVGFPQGVHLAYDGQHARPALAWKGRFFDAYTTWFSRFAPFEKPLGESIVKWPESSPGDPEVTFLGYRLDVQGVPTFLWQAGDSRVSERFEPVNGGLRRTLRWDPPAGSLHPVTHPGNVTVTEEPGNTPGERRFLYTWK